MISLDRPGGGPLQENGVNLLEIPESKVHFILSFFRSRKPGEED